jgi:hypothetical protein
MRWRRRQRRVRGRRGPDAPLPSLPRPSRPPAPHPVGQWLTVTSEFKDGLPFDWDQVRVFIWNTRKHRYETAYRLRDLQGYLPVKIGREMVDKMGEEPTFVIRTSPDGVATQDAEGLFHPQTVVQTQYRLEGGIVRRDTPLPGQASETAAAAQKPVRHGEHTARHPRVLRRHRRRPLH